VVLRRKNGVMAAMKEVGKCILAEGSRKGLVVGSGLVGSFVMLIIIMDGRK
jgi:hypothetical protein